MNPPEMNVQNMIWRPALIRLNQAAIPGVDDDTTSTPCFVDPQQIGAVFRSTPKHTMPDGSTLVGKTCTYVHCCHYGVWVEENPEVVAMLRDKALGYTQGPKSI